MSQIDILSGVHILYLRRFRLVDIFQQIDKCFLYIFSCHCRCLLEEYFILFGPTLSILSLNDFLSGILLPQVRFVSDQSDNAVFLSALPDFLQPHPRIFKGILLSDVVDEKSAHGLSVVCLRDGSVSLLASSVSNLCFDEFPILQLYYFGGELYSNCGNCWSRDFVLDPSREKTCFPHTGVSH